jgi:hypothetical protein
MSFLTYQQYKITIRKKENIAFWKNKYFENLRYEISDLLKRNIKYVVSTEHFYIFHSIIDLFKKYKTRMCFKELKKKLWTKTKINNHKSVNNLFYYSQVFDKEKGKIKLIN